MRVCFHNTKPVLRRRRRKQQGEEGGQKGVHQYSRSFLSSRRRSSTEGRTSSSSDTAEPTNESFAPTRRTGASRCSKQLAAMRAATSAPQPSVRVSS